METNSRAEKEAGSCEADKERKKGFKMKPCGPVGDETGGIKM